jgi:hypothetical protein
MALPWLRLWHEFASDPAVQVMSEAMQRRLIMVFCFKQSGDLEKLEESELAKAMGIDMAELTETKRVFLKKGFIDANWEPANWEKRQTRDHGAAERMRKHREHERNGAVTESVTENEHDRNARTRSVSVSLSHAEEGGVGGETIGNPPNGVAALAARTEGRWPAQNADSWIGDMCKTFDYRLVSQVTEQAWDMDPKKLPRAWIRKGCQGEMSRGWTPEIHAETAAAPSKADVDTEVEKYMKLAEGKWNAKTNG